MRARDRTRIEREIYTWARLAGVRDVSVVCARDLPDAWAIATTDGWIVLNEARWAAARPGENRDTVEHELAHVLAWQRHGDEIQAHGREWRRALTAIRSAPRLHRSGASSTLSDR